MADPRRSRQTGFSMVELLVALVFTSVLMAGMAAVFKANLGSLYTSGETLSSVRRNRMSLDLMQQDLNYACLYMNGVLMPSSSPGPNNPPFCVWSNMPVTDNLGQPAGTSDQIYFQTDVPMAFIAHLTQAYTNATGNNVANGTAPAVTQSLDLDCQTYANAQALDIAQQGIVAAGLDIKHYPILTFMDGLSDQPVIVNPNPMTYKDGVQHNSVVTLNLAGNPTAYVTGLGSIGIINNAHRTTADILVVIPDQIIRYQVQYLNFDPTKANGVPCLVRDVGSFDGGGNFVLAGNDIQQVVAENVQQFKAYLSVNAGQNWAGLNQTWAGLSGWNNGMVPALATQLAGYINSTSSSLAITTSNQWFRNVPTLVRLDITTQTANQRTEYATQANQAAFRTMTQSLVFVPMQSGVPQTETTGN
jgi:Tfp pilus assembly protein PilW